jgi:dTDP-glucose 4,6-dehydratase
MILRLLGKPESLLQHVTDRPGHDRRYALDVSTRCRPGLAPRHSFDEAMEKTVRWYVENEWWWRKITSGEHYRSYYDRLYGG